MYENRYYVIIKAHDHNETITKLLLSSLNIDMVKYLAVQYFVIALKTYQFILHR